MPDQTQLLDKAEAFFLERLPDAVSRDGQQLTLSAPIPVSLKRFLDTLSLSEAAELIPEDLDGLTSLHINTFSVDIEGRVDFTIILKADTGDRWKLIPGFVELDRFLMQVAIDPNALGPALYGQLSAELAVAGFNVQASLNVPDLLFAARVTSSDPPPNAGDLLSSLGIEDAGFGQLALRDVSIAGSAQTRYLFFALTIDAPWSLEGAALDFAVEDIGLELMYVGGDDGSLTGSIQASATLGQAGDDPIVFDVSAVYEGAGAGWTFVGSAENIVASDPVGAVLNAFSLHSESPFGAVTIHRIDLEFNTRTKDFRFGFDGTIELDGVNPRIIAEARLTQQPGGGYTKFFSGQLMLGERGQEKIFDLVFDQNSDGSTLVGVFRNSGGQRISLMDLAKAVTGNRGNQRSTVDKDLDFNIKQAVFAYQNGGKFLFAIDMDFGVELSGLGSLPVIGAALPKDLALSLAFQPIVSSKGSKAPDVGVIRGLLPAGGAVLPDTLTGGFQLLTSLNVAGDRHMLDLGLTKNDATDELGSTSVAESEVSGANSALEISPLDVTFIDVEKSFGPLHVGRVGISLRRGQQTEIGLVVDGAISIAGLTLSLDGLGALYNLKTQDLQFFLRGLGIEFERGPIEIAGAFLNLGNDFAGKVKISAKQFEITALGAMAMVKGQPALFLYGLLDYPLGGPPFFFVEGLAVGFGYNRSFTAPEITALRQFPLVQDALESRKIGAGADPKDTVTAQLERLGRYIQPSLGEYFITAGIKFTSFKLLNSFILVTVSFGKSFEVDILGASTYQNPPELLAGMPALARIEMNLLGRFAPDEGFLGVQAQLTDRSYVISEACKITGGFAFFSWFGGDFAGDFVLTVGGYHPKFVRPAHYPTVPRLGLNFQITENIYIKGSAYFALTPSTLMAGGAIEAHADIGPVAAWFGASLDMLISWEPYYYSFSVNVHVGARFGILEFEVGAGVEIWGPEFSGIAHIDLGVKTFDIEFGELASRGPTPIGWDAFKTAFLPDDTQICSTRIVGGIVYEIERDSLDDSGNPIRVAIPVINPKDLRLETNSVIPALSGQMNGVVQTGTAGPFGVAPMDLATVATSSHRIALLREVGDGEFVPVEDGEFRAEPVVKKFPRGLWGQSINVDMNAGMFDAIAGYTITIGDETLFRPGRPEGTRAFKRQEFDLEPPTVHTLAELAETDNRAVFEAEALPDVDRRSRLQDRLTGAGATTSRTARDAALSALGFDPAEAVSLSDDFTNTFVIPPNIVR